jgi:hypothetical protein
MSLLLVDIGNSRVKWAHCEHGVLGEQRAAAHAAWSAEDWRNTLFEGAAVERVLSTSADTGATGAEQALAARADAPLERVLVRDRGQIFPIAVAEIEYLKSDSKYTAITARGSQYYVRVPLADGDACREALGRALGLQGRVRKRRSVVMVGRTRVHLDAVEGLGDFMELEVVLRDGEPDADGAAEAEAWTKGVVANFKQAPQGNDTAMIEAVAAGQCRVSVVNTYYLARYAGGDAAAKAIFDKVGVIFPDQGGVGTHVNVSGAGLVKTAPNRDNAVKFLEYQKCILYLD